MNYIKFSLFTALLLSGCANNTKTTAPESSDDKRHYGFGSILGDEGLSFDTNRRIGGATNIDYSKISINPYLWQATVQTFNDVPLVACDSIGGSVITDWYTPKGAPDNEKLKVSVYLSGKILRASGVRVVLHKKVKRSGHWQQIESSQKHAEQIEDIILSAARRVRIKHQS